MFIWSIVGAALLYVVLLGCALAFVAAAARGRTRWERGLRSEIDEMNRDGYFHDRAA